jgi:hypothetical protein
MVSSSASITLCSTTGSSPTTQNAPLGLQYRRLRRSRPSSTFQKTAITTTAKTERWDADNSAETGFNATRNSRRLNPLQRATPPGEYLFCTAYDSAINGMCFSGRTNVIY